MNITLLFNSDMIPVQTIDGHSMHQQKQISHGAYSTWVEVDQQALGNNYHLTRDRVGPTSGLLAVVKANAYGHGMVEFAQAVEKLGVDWLGVGFIEEATALRTVGIKTPILMFVGVSDKDTIRVAAQRNISVTVSTFKGLEMLTMLSDEERRRVRIHLKIDTGMHRQGFSVHDIERALHILKGVFPSEGLEGVYTHFGAAENPDDREMTEKQFQNFQKILKIIHQRGFRPLKHAATTTSMLIYPESRFDIVRVGAALYGIWPSEESKVAFSEEFPIRPILSWKARVSEVKTLRKGATVGYDFTAMVERDTILALCPVGYWYGYRRRLSNRGYVLVHEQRAAIIGRVAMNMIAIDVTDIRDVDVGDEVTLIGRNGKEEISLDTVASLAGELNKDIITGIHPFIPRVYVNSDA